ncbi:MAG: undecaprenyl-phosphate glucose phosphotransferase [Dehalococcoidia bacterium]|nr:undecaprenyl-phosphate glucose phosphotransferase [Dehalococcoidia bacterium]
MFSPRMYILLTVVMVLGDVAMMLLSLGAAHYIRFDTALLPPGEEQHGLAVYLSMAAVELVVLPLVFAFRGMYQVRRNISRVDEMQRVFGAMAITTLVALAVVALGSRDFPYSRALLALHWLFAIPLVWALRLAMAWVHGRLRRHGMGVERVLLVGAGEIAQAIVEKMASRPDWGYHVAGYLADAELLPAHRGLAYLGTPEVIDAVVRSQRIDEVILADPALTHQRILALVQQLDSPGISIKVFPDVFQLMSTQVTISDLHGLPLMSVRDASLRGWRFAVKRVVDVVVSAVALVLLSPILLFIALLIKLTSPDGPVFYVQERVGLNGKSIWVLKFRSMRPDAEQASGPVWASRGDERATRLGRFLRRSSLDELPQFVNVLLGDMSIVGPRPERPHFVRQFSESIPDYWKRHWEKAGVTGWAQVNGLRGDTSIEERTAYDLWYVENWNLLLDFKIMLRTLPAMFRDSNG